MSHYFYNLLRLPPLYFIFKKNIKVQQNFLLETLVKDIALSKLTNDNTLDEQDYKKMTGYYGFGVPAILGELYCILQGRIMTTKERLALTYLGGATGLFDDFFDKMHMTESYIRTLLEKPENLKGKNSFEQIALKFYNIAIENSVDAHLLKHYSLQVFEAQILSKRQTDKAITQVEIERITFYKGAVSLMFYRCAINGKIGEAEQLMLEKLGSVLQLENDIFDVYKDSRDNIYTLVTTTTSIDKLRKKYLSLTEEMHVLVQKLSYPEKNIHQFLQVVSLLISRGLVCLDMLKSKEKHSNNIFTVKQYKRKDLICDMEKPINFLKTIHYFAKLNYNK